MPTHRKTTSTFEASGGRYLPRCCERCHAPGVPLIMSRFNTQMICLPCETRERAHPAYAAAARAELEAVRRGERNFPGLGKPADL
jgi:hypothetical protein